MPQATFFLTSATLTISRHKRSMVPSMRRDWIQKRRRRQHTATGCRCSARRRLRPARAWARPARLRQYFGPDLKTLVLSRQMLPLTNRGNGGRPRRRNTVDGAIRRGRNACGGTIARLRRTPALCRRLAEFPRSTRLGRSFLAVVALRLLSRRDLAHVTPGLAFQVSARVRADDCAAEFTVAIE